MIPTPSYQFKLVLVGQSSVGKSSILNRFVDDQFTQSLLSTIGVDFKFRKLKVNNEQVKLQIWDTAGQQTFRSIVSAYYNSSDAIIIVYDITSYRSIQSVKDYWLTEAVDNNKSDACLFLIGNKIDDQYKREVQNFTIESVLENHRVDKNFEVSAKTGENIESTFIQICKVLINKKKKTNQKVIGNTPQLLNSSKQDQQRVVLNSEKINYTQNGKRCCIK